MQNEIKTFKAEFKLERMAYLIEGTDFVLAKVTDADGDCKLITQDCIVSGNSTESISDVLMSNIGSLRLEDLKGVVKGVTVEMHHDDTLGVGIDIKYSLGENECCKNVKVVTKERKEQLKKIMESKSSDMSMWYDDMDGLHVKFDSLHYCFSVDSTNGKSRLVASSIESSRKRIYYVSNLFKDIDKLIDMEFIKDRTMLNYVALCRAIEVVIAKLFSVDVMLEQVINMMEIKKFVSSLSGKCIAELDLDVEFYAVNADRTLKLTDLKTSIVTDYETYNIYDVHEARGITCGCGNVYVKQINNGVVNRMELNPKNNRYKDLVKDDIASLALVTVCKAEILSRLDEYRVLDCTEES